MAQRTYQRVEVTGKGLFGFFLLVFCLGAFAWIWVSAWLEAGR